MVEADCVDCCMKVRVVIGHPEMAVKEAAWVMAENRVGTLPVVDEESVLVGVITLRDIIHLFLPDFVDLVSAVGFVKDFGEMETPSTESLNEADNLRVADIMHPPVSVQDDTTLIRALSILEKQEIADLPVVGDGKLVGLVSRVDIGRAFLSHWLLVQPD